jgi:hypothetical protein
MMCHINGHFTDNHGPSGVRNMTPGANKSLFVVCQWSLQVFAGTIKQVLLFTLDPLASMV